MLSPRLALRLLLSTQVSWLVIDLLSWAEILLFHLETCVAHSVPLNIRLLLTATYDLSLTASVPNRSRRSKFLKTPRLPARGRL